MQIQTADEIMARIDAARAASPGGVVAFDGDGTLWSGDVGEDFFHAIVARNDFRPAALAQLEADAREFGIDDAGDGGTLARRIFDAYVAGLYPEERICELMTWACADWSRGEVDAFCAEQIAGGALVPRLHAEAMRVVAWARAGGLETFIVSASPRPIVEAAARVVGVLPGHVVAATARWSDAAGAERPAVADGAARMLASVHRPIPYGPGKVTSLRDRIGDRTLYAAFGDNAFDVALLAEAKVPVAVRPKPRLRARAAEVKMLVEIAHER
jgi:phosphatidylglycerophosphatase C